MLTTCSSAYSILLLETTTAGHCNVTLYKLYALSGVKTAMLSTESIACRISTLHITMLLQPGWTRFQISIFSWSPPTTLVHSDAPIANDETRPFKVVSRTCRGGILCKQQCSILAKMLLIFLHDAERRSETNISSCDLQTFCATSWMVVTNLKLSHVLYNIRSCNCLHGIGRAWRLTEIKCADTAECVAGATSVGSSKAGHLRHVGLTRSTAPQQPMITITRIALQME